MEYEVLYYKRTNKVHKSRGVSKLDGVLLVQPQEGTVVLRASGCSSTEEEGDSSSSEDEGSYVGKFAKRNKKKKKKNKPVRSNPSGTVFSGRNHDIAKRDLEEDDVVILGGFEVQIIAAKTNAMASKSAPAVVKNMGKMGTTSLASNPRPAIARPRMPGAKFKPALAQRPLNRKPLLGTQFKKPALGQLPLKRKAPGVSQGIKASSQASQLTTKTPLGQLPMKRKAPGVSRGTKAALPIAPSSVLPHIPLTAKIRSALRPHQISGVDFIWGCLTGPRRGCLIGDEMGLGKTLMTIAAIAALHKQNRKPSFVVVCPSSLVANWAKEFDLWLGKAGQPRRVAIQKGGDEGKQHIRAFCSTLTQNLSNSVGQVLIVSYDLFRLSQTLLRDLQPGHIELLACDEAHKLKSESKNLSALQALPTKARLCLTATPVQNNLSEFYRIADFTCPGLFGDLQQFRREFDRPISAGNNKHATREQREHAQTQSQKLKKTVDTFMLRRLAKDVLTTLLPPRTEALLFCLPSPQQAKLYRETSSRHDSTEVLETLATLRKVSLWPATDFRGANASSVEVSGKMKVLDALLGALQNAREKVVVVSSYTSALTLLEDVVLKPRQMTYARLDGTTDVKQRQTLVDSFNMTSAEHTFVFLLSTRAGGCGLNLTGASRLIMMDLDWNPAHDIQAMARIYRQGQKRPTTIYRLLTSGTIDEFMYQRQLNKVNLSSLAMDGNQTESSYAKEELLELVALKEGCVCDTKEKIGKTWPEYRGVSSLKSSKYQDEALLHVAQTCKEELNFVHFVEETEMTPIPSEKEDGPPPHDSTDCSSSEEEEFD